MPFTMIDSYRFFQQSIALMMYRPVCGLIQMTVSVLYAPQAVEGGISLAIKS